MDRNRLAGGPLTTIRFRLAGALALALLPVLLLGVAQAGLAYHKDGEQHRLDLGLAAERAAATARARIESAGVLLETLAPDSVGFQCAQRLSEISHRLKGYDNLIRFDAQGRVNCAAGSVLADPTRSASDWFSHLREGRQSLVIPAPRALNARRPSLLAAERATNASGGFDGALVAVISLDSLSPDLNDRALPQRTAMGLADSDGRYLMRTDAKAFATLPARFADKARSRGSLLYTARAADGENRDYSVAPLAGDLFVVLSAPEGGLFTWAWVNPLSSILFPLLAFTLALTAVWVVTERVVIRWLNYLRRISTLYAKGRFSVRAIRVDAASPEIQELAHALETMAEAIVARDQSLRESLEHKDALMREIHHRVKNNLQIISSLINMQRRSMVDPAARVALSDTSQRIGALALIYRALYQGPDLKRVDIRNFLADLMGQLVVERHDHGAAVRTDVDAEELIIDPDKLAPFALFAVEAIGNAQKHALGIRGGVLKVRFTVNGEEARLSISDEGKGDGSAASVGGGLGHTLMAAFARQLRGRMELGLNDSGGVTATLIFPTGSGPLAPAPEIKPKRSRAA